jgi:predicted transcriptional regulator
MVDENIDAVAAEAEEAELPPEEEERLPFPTARVVRIIKENMSKPHQIRAEVKLAANEFMGEVLKDIAREMDKEEVFTLNTEHFNKAVKKYKMIEYQQKRIDRIKKLLEKQRAEIDEVITEIDLTREMI